MALIVDFVTRKGLVQMKHVFGQCTLTFQIKNNKLMHFISHSVEIEVNISTFFLRILKTEHKFYLLERFIFILLDKLNDIFNINSYLHHI